MNEDGGSSVRVATGPRAADAREVAPSVWRLTFRHAPNRALCTALGAALLLRLLVSVVPDGIVLACLPRGGPMARVRNPGPSPVLPNGQMTDGQSTPAGWTLSGEGRLSRDCGAFHSGPASLRLEVRGSRRARARVALTPVNGAFLVRGYVRTQGELRGGRIAVQIEAFGRQRGWLPVATVRGSPSAGGEWRSFAARVVLPSMACSEHLVIQAAGTGRIWLDDLSVTRIGE